MNSTTAVAGGLGLFFALLIITVSRPWRTLFGDPHGRSHRLVGALEIICLCIGLSLLQVDHPRGYYYYLGYDVLLGVMGCIVTYTASRDFPHKYVESRGVSGTLSSQSMVTYDEMMEHIFYQILNLVHVIYLHAIPFCAGRGLYPRSALLLMVTCPWWVRRRFPVHPFSQNWTNMAKNENTSLESILYRLKKYQYLFYKHVVLHGLNLTLFLQGTPPAVMVARDFRLFWLLLNTSYVMEFFLQSLVRRHVLSQSHMLFLNRCLMVLASAQGVTALRHVHPWLSLASLVFNLAHRGHDVTHTLFLAACAWVYYEW